jgi:hypothetical protein
MTNGNGGPETVTATFELPESLVEKPLAIERRKEYQFKEFGRSQVEFLLRWVFKDWELATLAEEMGKGFRLERNLKDGTNLNLYILVDRKEVGVMRTPPNAHSANRNFGLRNVQKFKVGDYEITFSSKKQALRLSNHGYSLDPKDQYGEKAEFFDWGDF